MSDTPQKICIVIHNDSHGGAASDGAKFAKGFYDKGWAVDLVILASKKKKMLRWRICRPVFNNFILTVKTRKQAF